MKKQLRGVLYAAVNIIVVIVAGCSGGDGSSSDAGEAPAPASQLVNAAISTSSEAQISQPTSTAGSTLYDSKCAVCHGTLASSSKKGMTVVRLQDAIGSNIGGMGFLSTLTTADIQALVSALSSATSTPAPTPTQISTSTSPPVLDGSALYSSNCASCHGALASSTKVGATTSRIQTAINSGTGGMGLLSALSSLQIDAIASTLSAATPGATSISSPACGSCHAIPPVTGRHSKHVSKGVACESCHGTGYSSTSFNAATHNNGVKNIATNTGWNAVKRTCSNSCHGGESW